MLSLKIGLMLIASSAITLLFTTVAQADQYPQYVEIIKQSSELTPCQCATSNPLSRDDVILNDDKIGDKAIAKFGCDCAAHRRAIAHTLMQQIK